MHDPGTSSHVRGVWSAKSIWQWHGAAARIAAVTVARARQAERAAAGSPHTLWGGERRVRPPSLAGVFRWLQWRGRGVHTDGPSGTVHRLSRKPVPPTPVLSSTWAHSPHDTEEHKSARESSSASRPYNQLHAKVNSYVPFRNLSTMPASSRKKKEEGGVHTFWESSLGIL